MTRRHIDLDEQIGRRAATARLKAGLTQEQVAERLGVKVDCVARMERGRTAITAGDLVWFSVAYNVAVGEMLKGLRAEVA